MIPPGPRLGDLVIDVRGLCMTLVTPAVPPSQPGSPASAEADALASGAADIVATPTERVLLNNVSFRIPKGAIVGIIGGNGTGKTTLLRLIAGELTPQNGTIVRGSTVRIGLVSQSRAELDPTQRVIDVVGAGADVVSMGPDFDMPIRQYLASFNLVGELQTKLVRSLSGGERNRVHLARVLRTGANVLMLDEPTNDLDVDTLRSLEEALTEFAGVSILVSHDRYFLDRLATHLLVFTGDGTVEWFEGNFSEYAESTRGASSPIVAALSAAGTDAAKAAALPMASMASSGR